MGKMKTSIEFDKIKFWCAFLFLSSASLKKYPNEQFYDEFRNAKLGNQLLTTRSETDIYNNNAQTK